MFLHRNPVVIFVLLTEDKNTHKNINGQETQCKALLLKEKQDSVVTSSRTQTQEKMKAVDFK